MSNWRDPIIDKFISGAQHVYVASDPDGLLVEAVINRQVRSKGFDVLPFDDPIAFRHTYETKYRRHWANGDDGSRLVVRTEESNFSNIPFDVLTAGKTVSLRLSSVFPGLYVPVVRELNPTDWDRLYQAVKAYRPGELNAAETKTFILRHVFHIDPTVIENETSLLHHLLRRHYGNRTVPDKLSDHLIKRLSEKNIFADWPLALLITNASDLYSFLQERWPFFLHRMGVINKELKPHVSAELTYEGPIQLPFDNPDVKPYIDSLFLDRLLEPVTLPAASQVKDRWIRVGIRIDEEADRRYRFSRIANELHDNLPNPDADHFEWVRIAEKWAEITVLRHKIDQRVDKRYGDLRHLIDEKFAEWMDRQYGGLYNQPPPVMAHHVPRFMARRLTEGVKRVAVLVIDGLALDQWIVIRNMLRRERRNWTFDEGAIFAWVPTLTDVSRQAIFSGKMPQEFPTQLGKTSGEELLWSQFWDNRLSNQAYSYLKVEGQRSDLSEIRASIRNPTTKALGMVFYQVDEIMHGMTMGTAGMHRSVDEWAERSALILTLDALREEGYRTFITSDHGNIEAVGAGKPQEGSTAQNRGRRARIYNRESLRAAVADEYSESIKWPSSGLPDNYYPLLSTGRSMFDREGECAVVHGGAALEEVIVPFIELR